MKIGIVGNYGNDNNGDEAILLSVIQQVKDTFNIHSKQITVFSNNPAQTSKRYEVESYPLYYKNGNPAKTFLKTFKENRQVVATFDLLIIGGGGILMDLYKREAPLYGSYAMMAKRSNVPYIVYGCGAGPLNTSLGKWFIRYMCKHAQSVSVRDPESKQLLNSIGVSKEVLVMGDPAFSLLYDRQEYSPVPRKIGVTAVPYYNNAYWPEGNEEKYNNYITGMAKNLDEISTKYDVEITFFATKFPQDADVTKDILTLMTHKQNVKIIDQNLLPVDLMEVTANQDLIIGTRLHSLILATDTKTPIMAVGYHHKVTDFMKLANLDEFIFHIDDIHIDTNLFVNGFDQIYQNWDSTIAKTKLLSNRLYEEAMIGKNQMLKAVK